MIVQHWHLKMVDTQAKTSGRQYAFSGDPLRRFSVNIAVTNSGKPEKKKKKKKTVLLLVGHRRRNGKAWTLRCGSVRWPSPTPHGCCNLNFSGFSFIQQRDPVPQIMERSSFHHLRISKYPPLFFGASSARGRTVLSQAFRCVTVNLPMLFDFARE